MQPRSDGGALSTQPGILGAWLNRKCEAAGCGQGTCAFSEDGFPRLDSLPSLSRSALGTPYAKALGQIETQTKRKNNYYLVSGIDYTFGQKKETTRMASTLMLAKSCSTRSRRDSFFLSGFLETPALFI